MNVGDFVLVKAGTMNGSCGKIVEVVRDRAGFIFYVMIDNRKYLYFEDELEVTDKADKKKYETKKMVYSIYKKVEK